MCSLFVLADPENYTFVTRKLRIQGHSTSVRLERGFWKVFEQIAEREGRTLTRLIAALYEEARQSDSDIANFSSCLRVLALQYVIVGGEQRPSPGQAGSAPTGHGGGGWDSQFAALRFAGQRLRQSGGSRRPREPNVQDSAFPSLIRPVFRSDSLAES